MDEAREETRGGWGTAFALLVAVAVLSVFHAFPLVALPLAVLLLALPAERRVRQMSAGALILALVFLLPGGALAALSRGWGLLLGSALVAITLARPRWPVLPRALTALAVGFVIGAAWLAASGGWGGVDAMMRQHYESISRLAAGDLGDAVSDTTWVQEFRAATTRVARTQWALFPAILGLQSLAALCLVAWWMGRLQPRARFAFRLRPLREFRFHDQMIWLVVVGLVLVALPAGPEVRRVGYNLLFFMGGLYVLRGVAIFLFLAGRAPSLASIVLGALAAIFLYPLVLTAILLVGVGDTWLDVRARAALAPPP